jgi:hypothetical protein
LYVFHKRKFPKLTPETQVSFANEAQGFTTTVFHYQNKFALCVSHRLRISQNNFFKALQKNDAKLFTHL